MHRHQSISIHFVHSILQAAKCAGLNTDQLLNKASINKKILAVKDVRITPEQLSLLMQAVWQTADDEYLCLAKEPSRHGIFSMMAKQVLPSQNLRQLLKRACHFYNLVTNASVLKLQERASDARFYITLAQPNNDISNTLMDFLLLVWHRFPSWLIGQRIVLKTVAFQQAKPEHHAEYDLMFHCKILYKQTDNYFEFSRELLDLPVVQTEQSLSAYLRRCPLDWFQRQAYSSTYTRKVIDYIEQRSDSCAIRMSDVADNYHLTVRTLRRKLLEEGTCFQKIKDNLRRDEAIHYLNQENININEVARLLGFKEAAAFSRAFKLWTGYPPSAYKTGKTL